METSKIDDLKISKAGEHIVAADLLLNGIDAVLSSHGSHFDIIADTKKGMIRIQVKTTREMRKIRQRANPIYFFHIKRMGKRAKKTYELGMFDCFALVALDRMEVFYLPFDANIKKSSICIRDGDIKYQGHNGGGPRGRYLQDLKWDNFYKNYAMQ